jgi:hypothetical protein
VLCDALFCGIHVLLFLLFYLSFSPVVHSIKIVRILIRVPHRSPDPFATKKFKENWTGLMAAALSCALRKYENGINLGYERADHWLPPTSSVNTFLISIPPNLQWKLSPHC